VASGGCGLRYGGAVWVCWVFLDLGFVSKVVVMANLRLVNGYVCRGVVVG